MDLYQYCPWDGQRYAGDLPHCHLCGCARGRGDSSKKYQPPWRKILYEKQPYADNYTDSSFLASMVMNATAVRRDYWTVVRDSVVVSQQMSTVVVMAVVAAYTLAGLLQVQALLFVDATLLAFSLASLVATDANLPKGYFFQSAFNSCLFVSGVFILSPIFQTLTKSISSDTIWACTIWLLLIHLFFHDYSYAHAVTSNFTGNISINASIFSAVLMASRLPSQLMVFALILFSLELSILFPVVWHHIRRYSDDVHLSLSLLTIASTFGLLVPLSSLLASLFILVIIFVTFVAPLWLIRIQKFKYEIKGPWDEAKLSIPID